MIGNDIIDLSISEIGHGERRIRYLNKILTENEIQLLDSLGNKDKWVWLLWSIKESVYKITHRLEGTVIYAPKSIQCLSACSISTNEYHAIVMHHGIKYKTKSFIIDDYISTVAIANTEEVHNILHESFMIPIAENQSKYLDKKIKSAYSELTNINEINLTIKRDKNRVPHLIHGKKERGFLSFSHHGQFGSFAFYQN